MSFLDPVFVVVQGARGIHIPLPFDRFGQDHVFYAFFSDHWVLKTLPQKGALHVLAKNLGFKNEN